MFSFYIAEKDRDTAIEWCRDNLVGYRRFTWFPFYTVNGVEAIRLDIFDDADCSVFKMIWESAIILKQEQR